MVEPHPDRPDERRDRIDRDVAELAELTAAGVEVDGEVQVAESLWVIYGRTSYDGEVVVGEYDDAAEAAEVLRAAPRRGPAPDLDPDPGPDPGPGGPAR